MNKKWDLRFLDLAYKISEWSKDPSTKVGAIIVDKQRRIISTGYNGLPQTIEDSDEILYNRDLKYEHIIHAEVNAIIFAKCSIAGFTLYTVPFLPCSRCASIYIQAGIARIVAPKNKLERWEENLNLSRKSFKESGVECVEYDIENFK